MYVNGTCVGVGPERLDTTADGKTVLNYNTYDVTDALVAGKNALTIKVTHTDSGVVGVYTLTITKS